MRLKMASVLNASRTLHSSAAQFDDKLEAAQQLLELLTPTGTAHEDCATLPGLVRAHYLRSLLDWTIGAVTKGAAAAGRQAQQKATPESRLRPELWALLVALLRSNAVAQSHPLPASLLPAATSALTALRPDGVAASDGSGASRQLLGHVSQLLHALGTKFQAAFKPGLELVVAAAEAALLGLSQSQEGNCPAWAEAVAATATLLLAFAQAPSQRKVWDAVVPRLAVPLIAAAFPADAQAAAPGATDVGGSCRRVLRELVFHQAHIAALAEACAPLPGLPPESGAAHRTYVVQFVELLGGQVRGLASGPSSGSEAALRCLPWLVEQCCAALGAHRRAAEVAAALTLRDSGRSWEQPAGGAGGEAGCAGGASKSADFHFYSAMLRLVLGPLADAMGGGKAAANEQTVERLLRAVAALTATLKQQHIYRPTEDPGGAHRQRLAEVADLAVAAAAAAPGGQPESERWEGLVGAALEVLQSILAVEHRVVQEHLPEVWPMLWAGSAAGGAAAQVARALAEAYSELRQLDVLLASLVEAVCAAPAASSAAAVVAVVCGGEFLGALQQAVRRLPSGQVSGIVRLVATWPPLLLLGEADARSKHVRLVLTDVGVACLDSLDVGIVTAPGVAEAAEALVTGSLALPLLQQLREADGRAAAELSASALAAGLHLYSAALRLHAHCCALHPQVAPLPGQSQRPGAGAAGSYFSALSAAATPPELLTVVHAAHRFNAAADCSAASALQYAALAAAAQRLRTLHLRRAYWEHRCGEQDSMSAADLESVESELAGLASALADAVAQRVSAAASFDSHAGSTPLASLTLHTLSTATAQLVGAHLPDIQAWAPEPALASLLHVALENASPPVRDVLEMNRLAAALPSATCSQLHETLSDLLGGADSQPPVKKKGKRSAGSAATALSAIMQQLQRLSKGKAVKQDAWGTNLQACCSALAAAAEDDTAARSGALAKSKKRKASSAAAEVDVVALEDLLRTLSSLELSCMPAESAHALLVAGMVAALAVLHLAISADAPSTASTLLGVAASALEVVACAALDPGLDGVGRGALLLAQSVPSFTAAVQVAASGLLPGGCIGAAERDMLDGICRSCRRLTRAYCAATLSGLADGVVGVQLGTTMHQALRGLAGNSLGRWVNAAFVEACLAACHAAARGGSWAESKAQAGNVIGGLLQLNGAALPNLPLAASLAAEAEVALPTIAAAAASGAAGEWQRQLLLGSVAASRAHVLHIRCAGGGSADAMPQPSLVISGMPADVQSLAAVLAEEGGSLPTPAALQLISYLEAACSVVRHIKPAASPAHFATLLALLLHLLQVLPPLPAGLDPARHTLPFAALFPAAAGAAGGAVRAALLMALKALLDGSNNQQLGHALRLAESTLVAPGGSGAGVYSVPLAELALMALEGGSGGGALRTLGQHADRVCTALTAFVAGAASPIGDSSKAGPASFAALLEAAIAAAPAAVEAAQPLQPPPRHQDWALAVIAVQHAGQRAVTASAAACTALRAMESMAARPRHFALSPRHLCHILQSVLALWARLGGDEEQGGVAHTSALFCGSCHLLAAVLRHRQLQVGRCLPVLAQALRALLAALVSWGVAAKLAGSASDSMSPPGHLCCAEMLAKVLMEVAGLKNASKYCPHLLADYLILAASPLSAKSRAILGLADVGRSSSDALASGLLSLEPAAALRQGAYALYGACSAAEVQYLYATLGSGGRGGGSGAWRAALAALRADHDKHFKYTGKV